MRKYLAVCLIAAVLVFLAGLYGSLYFYFLKNCRFSLLLKSGIIFTEILFAAAVVHVLRQRIREIKKENQNDYRDY